MCFDYVSWMHDFFWCKQARKDHFALFNDRLAKLLESWVIQEEPNTGGGAKKI
jgi:hypothetical protein